jgi:hypothetical protein
MNNNFFFYLGKISAQVLFDIAYFPIWWYSLGFIRFLRVLGGFLQEKWIIIGAGVWLKNLFTPMYGQSDFVSRLISFFVRLFQILFRFIAFLFFIVISIFLMAAWLILPVLIIYLIWQRIF